MKTSDTAARSPAGRRQPTQSRAVASRDAIIAGAKRLLSDKAFSDFTMRNLAKFSGVGLGTIYDYFPSWKDIVRVLLDERFELRQTILKSTLDEISFEQGLALFVPNYLQRLSDQGFWCPYDVRLREAAHADDELLTLLQKHESHFDNRYAEEMERAGSPWCRADLIQLAQLNTAVSQMIVSDPIRTKEAHDFRLSLVANMIRANLTMALRPRERTIKPS